MRTTERSKKKLTVWSYHRDGRTLQRATELQIFTQITSFQSLKNVGDYSEKMATVFNWRECKHPQSKSELSHCFIWNSMRWSSTWTHQKCVTALNVSSSSNSNHSELSQPYMLGPNPELFANRWANVAPKENICKQGYQIRFSFSETRRFWEENN